MHLYRYHDTIMRQKIISEAGSQQLLLDTYNLKTLLMHLHGLGAGAGDVKTPPSVYTKFIVGRAAQIETVLKLVGTAGEMLIERFRIMWPEGRMDDLVAIMTLKGMKKQDQQALLDAQSSLVTPLMSGASSAPAGGQTAAPTSQSSSYFSLEPSGGGAAMAAGGAAVASASLAVASSVTQMTSSAMTSLSAVSSNLKWGGAPTGK